MISGANKDLVFSFRGICAQNNRYFYPDDFYPILLRCVTGCGSVRDLRNLGLGQGALVDSQVTQSAVEVVVRAETDVQFLIAVEVVVGGIKWG